MQTWQARSGKEEKQPEIRPFRKNFTSSLLSYTEKETVIIQSEKKGLWLFKWGTAENSNKERIFVLFLLRLLRIVTLSGVCSAEAAQAVFVPLEGGEVEPTGAVTLAFVSAP